MEDRLEIEEKKKWEKEEEWEERKDGRGDEEKDIDERRKWKDSKKIDGRKMRKERCDENKKNRIGDGGEEKKIESIEIEINLKKRFRDMLIGMIEKIKEWNEEKKRRESGDKGIEKWNIGKGKGNGKEKEVWGKKKEGNLKEGNDRKKKLRGFYGGKRNSKIVKEEKNEN